jgi:hypothetical protein
MTNRAVVIFQAIKLIQEEGAVRVVDQAIQILENQEAGRLCPGLLKNLVYSDLLTRPTC